MFYYSASGDGRRSSSSQQLCSVKISCHAEKYRISGVTSVRTAFFFLFNMTPCTALAMAAASQCHPVATPCNNSHTGTTCGNYSVINTTEAQLFTPHPLFQFHFLTSHTDFRVRFNELEMFSGKCHFIISEMM